MKDNIPRPLSGIIPPMVTPLLDRDTLDVEGLQRLIEHILAGGVSGLFILGTTGEAPALSYRLRYELIERVCVQVHKRVPVLVGITDTSYVESLKLADFSLRHGADAAVLAPPYYFTAGQPELLEYLDHLAPKVPLPIFLYNMPGYTKVMIEPETVLQAARIPNIIGLKDSSANMIYFHKLQFLLADRPDFSLLIGPEELLAEGVLLGAHGGVCGGANILPSLYVNLYKAAVKREFDLLTELHRTVMKISTTLYSTGKYGSSILKGIKCSLKLMGICNDFVSEPFHRFREPEQERIKKALIDLNLL
jgi:dihydrodipicolinate synthase/N-acetylneuraminate lyase